MITRYKLTIAYDGTDFCGWQIQSNGLSVAHVLQDAFKKVFGEDVVILGASRTDAGVHAWGQVALLRTALNITESRLIHAWSALLPDSIVIRSIQKVSDDFHPFYNVDSKFYEYRMSERRPMPTRARYIWHVSKKIDWDRFKRALSLFEGTHDFSAFSTDPFIHENTVCTIHSIEVRGDESSGEYVIRIVGNRFLRHMVRRIIGAAFRMATAQLPENLITQAFTERVPHKLFMTAPAHGLTLQNIIYTS